MSVQSLVHPGHSYLIRKEQLDVVVVSPKRQNDKSYLCHISLIRLDWTMSILQSTNDELAIWTFWRGPVRPSAVARLVFGRAIYSSMLCFVVRM